MTKPDLNLLFTLDALLSEGSVTRAAQRLHLSPSAMSRALARLRATTGDPLLVRAGRGLVATPRALALREQVSQLVRDAEAVLRPATVLDLGQLARTFTLRSSDGDTFQLTPSVARTPTDLVLMQLTTPVTFWPFLRESNSTLSPGLNCRTSPWDSRSQRCFSILIPSLIS